MNNKSLKWQIPFLILLIVGTFFILKKQPPFHTDQGLVFGTMYKITYQHAENLKPEIEAALKEVDNSLSPFNKNSVITRINNNTDMTADSLLTDVFMLAKSISEETDGAFDITVAPLVNAWGFGFDSSTNVSRETIDSLRQFVGFDKISLKDGEIIKQDSRTMLDCSAIAKGYGVDHVARLLDSKGVENYMIDIGGELVLKGKNPRMNPWRIGINKPIDDSLSVNHKCRTCHIGQLPQLLLQGRQEICTYHKSAYRISCAAQHTVVYGSGKKLCYSRCLCHCFYGFRT